MIRENSLSIKILELLANNPYGLSGYRISKMLNVPLENVRYHLKKLVEDGIIRKEDRRYVFPYTVFIRKGLLIVNFDKTIGIFYCPYYGKKCKCSEKEIKKCPFLKEFPDVFKRFVERV